MPSPVDKPQSDFVWIDVEGPLDTSEKAFLYRVGDQQLWFPKSQCGARKKNPDGSHCRIEISRWIAREKGLVR